MEKRTVKLPRLQNAQDANKVQEVLKQVWGIRSVDEVSLARGEVTFTFDEKAAAVGDFYEALEECGFEVDGGEQFGTRM
ncbi:MAG: heavy-metal-associated domain-containing protein [Tumebacillaceae bacterium]